MARWDEIFSLPVQNPSNMEFSAADLVWSKVEGWREKIDRLALIPFARVGDFVRGESNNKECPSKFHVEARRKRTPGAANKPKVDGILEYILYWCSFGPDDHRTGGVIRPSRSTYVRKNKSSGRPNTKRGCTCRFIVKRLIAEPSVALIIYNQDKHIDKNGLPCHGPQDLEAVGTRAMYAPYISEELHLRVSSLLHVGVSVETIMQRHFESVEKQGGPCNRDDLLTHRSVRRQERSIRRSTYKLDDDDAISISMWVETQQNNVFFYQDYSDSEPLTLGIQTEWQLQQMIRFGSSRLLAYNSQFGSNKLKYSLHSLLVFNSEYKAIPVAWIITPRYASLDSYRWMRALYNRVCAKDPTWKLAGFIVDDPLADILAIREVFQCSVLICFWRVRHAWHKNLMTRCAEMEMRTEVAKQLGHAVNKIQKGSDHAFEDFMEDLVDAAEFMDYFKAAWYPKIGMWAQGLRNLPLASQESCAAMEFYHSQLKSRLLKERDEQVYQRSDWLVNRLTTKVHSYFWLDEYSEKEDFARYWKDEWMSGPTAWRKSLSIPDSHIIMEGKCAKVIEQEDEHTTHLVWNPGSEYAICDCEWAKMGNLCEHVFKVIKFCRDEGTIPPSISMLQYSQSLINLLHCPPFDSLVCDYATSLAVWLQMHLNAQIGLKCSEDNAEMDLDSTEDNAQVDPESTRDNSQGGLESGSNAQVGPESTEDNAQVGLENAEDNARGDREITTDNSQGGLETGGNAQVGPEGTEVNAQIGPERPEDNGEMDQGTAEDNAQVDPESTWDNARGCLESGGNAQVGPESTEVNAQVSLENAEDNARGWEITRHNSQEVLESRGNAQVGPEGTEDNAQVGLENTEDNARGGPESSQHEQNNANPSVGSPFGVLDDVELCASNAATSDVENQTMLKRKRTDYEDGDYDRSPIQRKSSEGSDYDGSPVIS